MTTHLATKKGSRARWRFRVVEDGSAKDLTGYTATIRLRAADGTLKISAGTVTIDDQVARPGEVYYDPSDADVDTAGDYRLELWVSLGGIPDRFPRDSFIRVTIHPTL